MIELSLAPPFYINIIIGLRKYTNYKEGSSFCPKERNG